MSEINKLSLVMPDASHEAEYCRVMDRWEAVETNIQPELMRRFSSAVGGNVSYEKWLAWCDDDRTTGSQLATKMPCTLFFLVSGGEILGAVVINHADTHRGHVHAGITPWNRGRGYGTVMLNLALRKCAEMGMKSVHIMPRRDNAGAVQTILRNGGVLLGDYCDNGVWISRYELQTIGACEGAL